MDEQTMRSQLEETEFGRSLLEKGFTVDEAYRFSQALCSYAEDTPENEAVREEIRQAIGLPFAVVTQHITAYTPPSGQSGPAKERCCRQSSLVD